MINVIGGEKLTAAKAIAARTWGDDYQARWFWIQVCRLFRDRTKVIRVEYETSNVKSLDDVAVFYENHVDEQGNSLHADYYQVKFHLTAAGAFTWKAMMNPDFINASSVSLLQRLKNAQQQLAPDGIGCRFILYSPWTVDPNDSLAKIYSQSDGRIIWTKLAEGGTRSEMGRVRDSWRKHLGLMTDDELQVVLRPLRIHQGRTLLELGENLNDKLQIAGLSPVEEGCLVHPYDDLIRKLLQTGRTQFTRTNIEDICKQERLWVGRTIPEPDAYRLGIRSFLRWAENLEDETDAMLDLLPWFNGRYIQSPELWQDRVYPEIKDFLAKTLKPGQLCQLHLHAHASIAFAAGYCLNSKSGVDVGIVQSTIGGGQAIWRPSANPNSNRYQTWEFFEEFISDNSSDVVLGLNVTHDVISDIKAYIGATHLPIHRIILCEIPTGSGTQSVLDATHAKLLTDRLSSYLKTNRTVTERQAKLHIFAAAPNALLFFIGQVAQSFGQCVLYEYDFDRSMPGAYQPSLIFPPPLSEHQ